MTRRGDEYRDDQYSREVIHLCDRISWQSAVAPAEKSQWVNDRTAAAMAGISYESFIRRFPPGKAGGKMGRHNENGLCRIDKVIEWSKNK